MTDWLTNPVFMSQAQDVSDGQIFGTPAVIYPCNSANSAFDAMERNENTFAALCQVSYKKAKVAANP